MSLQLRTAVSASRHHSRVCRRRISHGARLLHCSAITSSSSHSSTGVTTPLYPQQSFPTELLLIIFNFVFDDLASYCTHSPEAHKECVVCHSPYGSSQKHVVWEWQEDVSSYALFPYSLAGVCRRWRDIMAMVPQFWTRLVIFVDGPPSPSPSSSPSLSSLPLSPSVADIQSHLKWSARLPIEVYILRRHHNTSLGIDKTEQWKTRCVFEAIKPHIHRCHVLRFSVLQSTSLPSLVYDFAGVTAPLLTDLRLECEIDDTRVNAPPNDVSRITGIPPMGTSMARTTTASAYITQENALNPSLQPPKAGTITPDGGRWFWCPILSAISVNGRNFRDLALALRHSMLVTEGLQSGQQYHQGPILDFNMTLQHVEKVTVAYYSTLPEAGLGYGLGFETGPLRNRDCDNDEFRLEDLLKVVRKERMPKLVFLKLVDLELSVEESVGVGSVDGRSSGRQEQERGEERNLEVVELMPSYIHLEELAPSVIQCFSAFSSVDGLHPFSSSPGFCVRFVNELESFNIIRSSLPLPSSFSTPSSPSSSSSSSRSSATSSLSQLSSPSLPTSETGWGIPDACDLVLEEINDLYGHSSPLRGWQGCRLLCTGCNGVDNDFLKMLRSSSDNNAPAPLGFLSPSPPPAAGITANLIPFNAPNLQSIYLNDCSNYTIDELKLVIETRNAGVSVGWDAPPCILELCVKGIRPELEEEDRRWFEERVKRFEWGESRGRTRKRV